MAAAVRCMDLRKTYDNKVEAVRGLHLEVQQGECFGLLGPNGAGKTTTVEICEGLLQPTSGQVEILGRQWGQHDRELREMIGISLQETRLSEKLTVRETLELFASFYREPGDPRHVLETIALTEKSDAWVGKLSGGQQQRLAVACALISNPRVLFLDEPTTGLDPQSRRQLWDIIRGFKQSGGTVLITTHYMDEAERLCDRVAVIDHGQIIALGTPAELIASLGAEHVIEFSLADNGSGELDAAALAGVASVRSVRHDDGAYALTVSRPHEALPNLFHLLDSQRRTLARLTTRHASLEDVFVALTGRHLRDD